MSANLPLHRLSSSTNDIIILDGLWGSGKSLLAPVIGGMSGVEKYIYRPVYEYLSCLLHLGKISEDACQSLLLSYADMHQYHNLIGREVNLRWSDDSGFSNNPNVWRYIRRLCSGEGDVCVEKINRENLALFIMTQEIILVANQSLKVFGSRLKLIHIVKHPVYVFLHWYCFLERYNGPRVYNISFNYEGVKVPWFWEEQAATYASISLDEKTAQSINLMYEKLFSVLDNLKISQTSFKIVSFESIVLETDKIMKEISEFLSRRHFPKLGKILKKQKIPRKLLNQGKGHSWYGFKGARVSDEHSEYTSLLTEIRSTICEETFLRFNAVIEEYNKRFPSILCNYH